MVIISEDWKEVIASRLRNRAEQEHLYEVLLNTVERDIDSLLNDLSADYGIKTGLKCSGDDRNRSWTIRIEDAKVTVTTEVFANYYRNHKDVKKAITEIIIDNFKFDFVV